jgi:hypothetical protein
VHWSVRRFPVFGVVMRTRWVWSTVEWHWQNQTAVSGEKLVPVIHFPQQNPSGVDPRLLGEGLITNCMSHEIDWRLKLIFITYKNSVQTSRRTQIFHLKIYWCVLCKEPIAVHGANKKNRLAITNVRNSVLMLNLAIYGGVSKKLRQLSGVSSGHHNSGNISYLCISTHI